MKAKRSYDKNNLEGAVLASGALSFSDSIKFANEAKISSIIQPEGQLMIKKL